MDPRQARRAPRSDEDTAPGIASRTWHYDRVFLSILSEREDPDATACWEISGTLRRSDRKGTSSPSSIVYTCICARASRPRTRVPWRSRTIVCTVTMSALEHRGRTPLDCVPEWSGSYSAASMISTSQTGRGIERVGAPVNTTQLSPFATSPARDSRDASGAGMLSCRFADRLSR
jgi:hypothetical protein